MNPWLRFRAPGNFLNMLQLLHFTSIYGVTLLEELMLTEIFNLINDNLKEIQEKFTILRENKARNEATIEGIDQRKKDLIYSLKNELNIENENTLLGISDLNNLEEINFPTIEQQEGKLE